MKRLVDMKFLVDRSVVLVLFWVAEFLMESACRSRTAFLEDADGRGCLGVGQLDYALYEREGRTFVYLIDLTLWATYSRKGGRWIFVLASTGQRFEGESLASLMHEAHAVWREAPVPSV